MLERFREMPPGVALFLGYGLLILVGIGLSMRWVVDQAISAPLSLPGIVVMILLAYTIFTMTLVIQRKEAARNLALGLSTLTLPTILFLLLGGGYLPAVFVALVAVALFVGLTRPAVRVYLREP